MLDKFIFLYIMFKGIFNFIRRYKIFIIIIVTLLLLYILPLVGGILFGLVIFGGWWIKNYVIFTGLTNICLICYINSVLYLLNSMPKTIKEINKIVDKNYIKNNEHKKIFNKDIKDINKDTMNESLKTYINYRPLYIISEMIKDLNEGKIKYTSEWKLVKSLKYASNLVDIDIKDETDSWLKLYKKSKFIGGTSYLFLDGLMKRYKFESFVLSIIPLELTITIPKKNYIFTGPLLDVNKYIINYKNHNAAGLLLASKRHAVCLLKKKNKWITYDQTKKSIIIGTNLSDNDIKNRINKDKNYELSHILYKYIG